MDKALRSRMAIPAKRKSVGVVVWLETQEEICSKRNSRQCAEKATWVENEMEYVSGGGENVVRMASEMLLQRKRSNEPGERYDARIVVGLFQQFNRTRTQNEW